MSYKLSKQETTQLFEKLSEKYDIYAPKLFKNEGRFSELVLNSCHLDEKG